MEASLIEAAGGALLNILDPMRMLFLASGVILGLLLGILPGIGGLTGMAMLLPFTFTMDSYTAFAFLLGLCAVTSTSDTIPAVLFGVPGSSSAQATVLNGLPMAKRGEAGRALSAAYMSSLIGGLFGALVLALTIPVIRPFIVYLGTPEMLALSLFGISMVAVLSGSTPLRGLFAACLGLMLAMVGMDPQTSTQRWTLGQVYLWEGIPLLPLVLGLFALPELCDLAIQRTAIMSKKAMDASSGMLQGAKDCFKNWWLVIRCSSIGSLLGAMPGVSPGVIDWIAYGHALRTEKGAEQTFGKGDVRGVIAPESACNAKEGGALVPTIAFGIPGSASMAILLGAFMIHGLVPGPSMLSTNLDITYTMVWSVAIANILGAGFCYMMSGQFAKLATLRYTLILPFILCIIYIGAFEGQRNWGSFYVLLLFGVIGWAMKQLKWPRPPLILGFVLGDIIERYMFISIGRYGADWLMRPIVLILLALSIMTIVSPLYRDIKSMGGVRNILPRLQMPRFSKPDGMYVLFIGLTVIMLYASLSWPYEARIIPQVVGVTALIVLVASFVNQVLRPADMPQTESLAEAAAGAVLNAPQKPQKVYMDLVFDHTSLPVSEVIKRAIVFFGWLVAFMASMALIGLIPTVPLFVVMFMRLENREPWRLVLPQAIGITLFIYVVFDRLLHIPWPRSILGNLFPILRNIPSM